ncbi:MAG: HAMP domain-containing protein, partial [Halieaceae bacterium]|nr:HAMP domain-containing protein [Halieaceae bacterium]
MSGISLTTRLVLLLTLTITITLSVITAADYYNSRDAILAEQAARIESTVTEAVRDIEVRLSVLEESTELLAEVIQSRPHTRDELLYLLREAVDDRDDLFGAAIALAPRFTAEATRGFAPYYYYRDGELTFSDLGDNYDFLLSDWYRTPLSTGRSAWTEPYVDAGSENSFMVTYSVPLFRTIDGQPVFYGVVTADILLQELEIYLARMDLGERGAGFLLSRSGKIMASPDRENWLKPWAKTISDPSEAILWGEIINSVTNEGRAVSATVGCLQSDENCVVKLAPLSSTRWPVGAYYSEREMLGPLRDYLTKSVLSQLLTLCLLLSGVIWVSRRITHPLRSLAAATVEIAGGDFDTALPEPRSKDELGRLITAFSAMQENLQRYVTELEQETASRNRLQGELEAATAIQMSMLPAAGNAYRIEDRFKLWAVLRPAKSVGGDLYTFQLRQDKRLFIAVGDVSDKGVPAALFMARAMTLLQQYVYTSLEAGDILARLNEELLEGNDNCMFLTL